MLTKIVLYTTDYRVIVYREGGHEVEVFVDGPGWVLDTEDTIDAEVLQMFLSDAVKILNMVATKGG